MTDVGDRYVLEAMRRDGAELGGEQSGHVIALAYATTGDGMLTAALLLAALAHAGQGLAEAAQLVRSSRSGSSPSAPTAPACATPRRLGGGPARSRTSSAATAASSCARPAPSR